MPYPNDPTQPSLKAMSVNDTLILFGPTRAEKKPNYILWCDSWDNDLVLLIPSLARGDIFPAVRNCQAFDLECLSNLDELWQVTLGHTHHPSIHIAQ
ncbi:hypothetical protein E2C01_003278 [Portunus trituberculatus]|uniref:Uncharacterized protein n=1 Tax=Portunus trituberculatus TaxID=210409 RepID=A0A5B7CM61_PORTR|nr:hypothetical protein [Portunus trituberculatus]